MKSPLEELIMMRPRLNALMRHLNLEFEECTCRICEGDGCLQDGGECSNCDCGCGVQVRVVPSLRPVVADIRSLTRLNFKNLTLTKLHSHDIYTFDDLLRLSDQDLLRKKGVGRQTVKDIQSALRSEGLSLRKHVWKEKGQ